ncbi:MAG: AIR synthase-related protein [Candidatus Eiseniibacteriota bacterium]
MPEPLGKLSPRSFDRLIAPHLGEARPEVLVGPAPGLDAAILKLGAGRVMAVTTDPLSIVPALGPRLSAHLAAHLVASDLWTTGIPPAYASVSLHLPPETADASLEEFAAALGITWRELGVAVVTGHTGRYPGLASTVVGAATLMGVGDDGRYVTPAMAAPGDRVLITKGCAIEACAVAARAIPKRLAAHLDPPALERARAMIDQVSVVRECRALTRLGVRSRGVTAMHDATEGGVLGGLIELARACGHDLRIERARIPLSEEARAACQAWGGIDPYWALSEGALIACVKPESLLPALAALAEEGIAAAEVGEVMKGRGVVHLTGADGEIQQLTEPEADPYWPAYERAMREGWS